MTSFEKYKPSMSTFQDWKPVVLRKAPPKPSPHPSGPVPSQTGNKQAPNASVNMKRLDEDETYSPPMMTRALGQQIANGRSRLRLTQEQLAQKCSIPLSVIRDYERGQGVYNRSYLDPLCKLLDITLSRPKPKPRQTDS